MRIATWIICAALLTLFGSGASAATVGFAKIATKKGNFEDVRQDVADAIVSRGLVIDYTGKVGEMLARTAADVGARKDLYKSAVYMQFCSAKMSRLTMEADPTAIALCPYVIFVYELADKPGLIHVGYRRLPTTGSRQLRAAVGAVRTMLDEIIAKAVK